MATKRTAARRKPTATEGILLRYEVDQGRLTREQMNAIDRLQPPGRIKAGNRLF
ncbi:MAG: hypothetical protein ACREU5_00390 [Burkholderiales bacterium]